METVLSTKNSRPELQAGPQEMRLVFLLPDQLPSTQHFLSARLQKLFAFHPQQMVVIQVTWT